ncbi:amino acid transporter-like protein [Mollisia scopiformis]|uniref:Amino acid transporter-like protein n=1 Tax=Mollisia scopiformis TaxID=149040 RepID=A0A194X0I6_MOLSC|nr:amino acid transporter-like protein [Mollisia scopiformis]KUJ13711.1 amino acid transporter-like protein [Mollisia scopiformis]
MADIHSNHEGSSSEKNATPFYTAAEDDMGETLVVSENVDDLKRRLSGRQIQMMAIGGSVGTALFVSIGWGLIEGGPGSLLIGFIIYCFCLGTVNNCMAEMSIFMPVSGGFVRLGSKWVDESFGFMLGWNFFLYEAVSIPFEISAINLVLTFWRDDIPVAAVCAGCIAIYALINIFSVKYYGETEFWLSTGKVLLIGIVFCFTFITMVGGNPEHDAYGFRYWKTPGAFAEYVTTGSLGRSEGFLAGLWEAAFVVTGPEYVAMVAGEASFPRKTLKTAYNSLYWRFGFFFLGSAIAVGIVIPYNDITINCILTGAPYGGIGDCPSVNGASGSAAASPYVIAMQNLGIGVLPHLTNALLITSMFSAGNSFVYCSSRTLYALALDGHAPKFLRKCTKNGIPIYCFCVVMIFPFLSFLQIRSGTATVITWLANLTQASQVIDYLCMCVIYLFFYRGMKAQGFDRNTLPYKGWAQPFCGWFRMCAMTFTVTCYGYTTFLPGGWWDVGTFFSYYTMVFFVLVAYFGWKIVKRTKTVKASELDLVWERPVIDAYEATYVDTSVGFRETLKGWVGSKKTKHED